MVYTRNFQKLGTYILSNKAKDEIREVGPDPKVVLCSVLGVKPFSRRSHIRNGGGGRKRGREKKCFPSCPVYEAFSNVQTLLPQGERNISE